MWLRDKLLDFLLREERGSMSFEAIWAALMLSFFIAPTLYVMQVSNVGLEYSWKQRLSVREHAITSQDSPVPLCGGLPLGSIETKSHINAVIGCSTGEIAEPEENRFWPKLDEAVQGDFPTLLDDMKDEGEILVHNSNMATTHFETLELGNPQSLLESVLGVDVPTFAQRLPNRTTLIAPSTDYYRWTEDHWKAGHDQAIWDQYSEDSQQLYPNVFPSAE